MIFPAPLDWLAGQELEIHDRIEVPSHSLPDARYLGEVALAVGAGLLFRGWIGGWLALGGLLRCHESFFRRHPPRSVARSLRVDQHGWMEVSVDGQARRGRLRCAYLIQEERQYCYNWFFDVEQVVLDTGDFQVTLESRQFSGGMPCWRLHGLAEWLERLTER